MSLYKSIVNLYQGQDVQYWQPDLKNIIPEGNQNAHTALNTFLVRVGQNTGISFAHKTYIKRVIFIHGFSFQQLLYVLLREKLEVDKKDIWNSAT